MSQLDAETPVLSHNPDTAKLLKQWVDLQLSGHTHGGQFMIPGVGPAAFTKRPPQHAQIGTALGAIHAKRLLKWCGIGNGRRFPSGRNEPAVY